MARVGSLPDALGHATPSKSLPGAWWGILNEILMGPWLELKLVFLLIDSELEPNDFDSAELNVFWHKNEALLLLVMKDGVS